MRRLQLIENVGLRLIEFDRFAIDQLRFAID